MTLTRLESFPFDSRYDGFDDEGYPVYDRAVGSKTLRDVFAHFFSDGVFSDTTYPFRLTKAASGLAVTVNPGVIIINGGWGILPEATTLTLATGTTAGVIKYAVFARYDNNDEHRTLYLRTDASSAGGAVPEPSTTEANVTEYRIGYITVPSNSTNLGNATITNEVGTSKCPYAVPLFDIDPAEVLEDLRNDAQAAYDKYYALLQSAVDDTTAGHLQNQIDAHDGRISHLEENQFTQEDIDPQTLRSKMGLGNTLGVLGVPYGGTGVASLDELRDSLLLEYSENKSYPTGSSKWNGSFAQEFASATIPAGLYLVYAGIHNPQTSAQSYYYGYDIGNSAEKLNTTSSIKAGATKDLLFTVVAFTEDTTLNETDSSPYIFCGYYGNTADRNKLRMIVAFAKIADL